MKHIFFALLCLPQMAAAADQTGGFAVDGIGSEACSVLTEAVAQKDDKRIAAIASWMDGFLSGVNAFQPQTYDITPWQSTTLSIARLNAFCTANAEVPLVNAVALYAQSLGTARLMEESELVSVRHGGKAVFLYRQTLDDIAAQLRALGYEAEQAEDGFGEAMAEALIALQKEKGLNPTGLPNQETLNALFP